MAEADSFCIACTTGSCRRFVLSCEACTQMCTYRACYVVIWGLFIYC